MKLKTQRMFAWTAFVLLVVVLFALPVVATAAQAPSVRLDVSIGPGNVPTLTWDNAWATSCTASGDWNGAKAASGSETLPAITGTVNYRLTCVGARDDQARLTWTAPTEYTDGAPLPSGFITGYTVWQGTSPGTLQRIERVTALERITTNLADGTHYFAVTAHGQNGTESGFSAIGSKTITAAPVADDQEVIRIPNPPSLGGVQ